MKRLLLTGPNGFIGRHCLPFLRERGYEVHAVVPEKGMELEFPAVEWHVVDLLSPTQSQALIKSVEPSHLLHFAWVTQPGSYWTSGENLRWFRASLELLEAFRLRGGRRVLMAGSCAEYDWRYGYCSEAVTPLTPTSLYGTCKKALYEVLESFARQEGLSVAWGRIFFLYGPHEHPSRLVASVISAILAQRPAPSTQTTQIRDFLYVEDVASAFAALLDSEVQGAVNIASGQPVLVGEIVRRIGEQLGRADLVQGGALPISPSDPPLLVADVTRLRDELAWIPSYSLEAGLRRSIEWWKTKMNLT
jgi:nucleoside-diphosphate-sugar epimerase